MPYATSKCRSLLLRQPYCIIYKIKHGSYVHHWPIRYIHIYPLYRIWYSIFCVSYMACKPSRSWDVMKVDPFPDVLQLHRFLLTNVTWYVIFTNFLFLVAICESGESSGASTPGSEKEIVIVNNSVSLTQHPARQGVMDFLRVIVLDSLPLNVSGKVAPVSYNNVFVIL